MPQKTKTEQPRQIIPLTREALNPLWLSVSEASKMGGVNNKTIRRAILSKSIKYKIIKQRYFVDFASLVQFLHSTKKLKNKLGEFGLGQYVLMWKK